MSASKWQDGLDPESSAYRFASCEVSTCRSLAGPGTGKTFSLMRKIAYLLDEKKVDPKKILILTFTRAGAADIKQELENLGIFGVEKIHASTLHSFCMGILRRRDILKMLERYPRPLLDHEVVLLLNDINTDERFGKQKEREKMLRDYESAWARLQIDEPGFVQSEDDVEFQKRIRQWMLFHKAMTIGEIIPFTLKFIRSNPTYQGFQSYDYVLVDEYQDLNKAEQVIIDMIAEGANLTIVGDDNQSIYSFKNAHPEGIRQFTDKYKPCGDIPMQECRRCPKKVVEIANALIQHDSHHQNTTQPILLPFADNGDGEVDIIQWSSYEEEVNGIAKIVKGLLKSNPDTLTPDDVLILDPSKKIAKMINDELNEIDIPSHFVSRSVDIILDCDEAKWIYAFITFLAYDNDYVAFRYMLQKNRDFYSQKYNQIMENAKQQNMTPVEIFQAIIAGAISIPRITKNTAIVKRYTELLTMISEWKKIDTVEAFINSISEMCGENAIALRDRIIELSPKFVFQEKEGALIFAIQFARYLAKHIINVISANEDTIEEGKVRVMTCHSAKGLSGKLVIVASCVDGLIPRISNDNDQHILDEQRRLFYVALTRCKYTPDGFPGRLIISSFISITNGQKLSLGIKVTKPGVNASRFLMNEVPIEILPEAQIGKDYWNSINKQNTEGIQP